MRDTLSRLASAQKGRARGAPAYSVYVNRPVGRVLAAIAYRMGLTPNQVTIVSAVFTFAGIAVIALAPIAWWSGVLAWLLLALGYAWDSADGQVARLRGGGSLAGEWLDHFVDALKISSLHLAVLIGLSRVDGLPAGWLLVPIAFTVVANTTFFAMILNDLLKGKRGVASAHSSGGGSPLRSLLLLPTDFGIVLLAFVAWGWPPVFITLYTLLLIAAALFLLLAAAKWFRDMSRIDRETATR
jgi:phosphatidylglycerophosphate synthase